MSNRIVPIALVAGVLVAGGYALFRTDSAPPRPAEAFPPASDPGPAAGPDPHAGALPPNHPAIGASSGGASAGGPSAGSANGAPAMPPSNSEPPAITWKAPAAWPTAPNPSTMRIATYRVPHASGDTDDAEVSVVRAGGTTDANIERWIGQFEDAGKDTRTVKTVRGLKVTVVEVSGTYAGGGPMMGGGATAGHPKWALLGAVVETPGAPYFFKMTGPVATVHAARTAFDALLESITPS